MLFRSLSQSTLTQNDAMFVVTAVTSPATVYLWFIFGPAAISRQTSPLKLTIEIQKISRNVLFATIVGSFPMSVAMFVIITMPTMRHLFSQQACSEPLNMGDFSLSALSPSSYLIQLLCIYLGLALADGLVFLRSIEDNETPLCVV